MPEIRRGAWAAWARAGAHRDPLRPVAIGDACRTIDGRPGSLVEIDELGRTLLVCQAN